jgi:hypothetical protein
MLGNLFLYAANRASQGAVGNVARQASWGGFAVFLLLAGAIFSLVVTFVVLDARLGAASAGVIIAAGCFVAGLVCLSMPGLLDWMETKPKPTSAETIAETSAVVHEEMTQAVDYFGAVRVVASAFLLGLSAARQLKQRVA